MQNISKRALTTLSILVLIALAIGQTPVLADVLEPTAILPPPNGGYTLPLVCITPVCLTNILFSDFQVTSTVFMGGNEQVSTTALLTANVFQNVGGNPGLALGPLSVPGAMDITYFGRSLADQLGTFQAQITNFDFMSTFNGHPFEAEQNPAMPSLGSTTITELGPGKVFQVSSFFDVFAELSLNSLPFVAGPERTTTLVQTPEPGSLELTLLGLFGLAGLAGRQLRRQSR